MARISDLDLMQRARRFLVGVVMVLIGAVLGYALPQSTASPKAESGTAVVVSKSAGGAGFHFLFRLANGSKQSYQYESPTPWQATPTGAWHATGQPSCLVPGSTKPTKITLGIVNVHAGNSTPGGPIVVWIECY